MPQEDYLPQQMADGSLTEPTSEQPQPQADDPYAELREPNGKIFGKWDSIDEAKRGIWHQQNSAAQLEAQMRTLVAMQSQRPDPSVAQARREDVWKQFDQYALPGEALRDAVRQEAAGLAQQIVQQEVMPVFNAMAAEQQIASLHKDYPAIKDAVYQYVGSNPMYAQMFQSMVASNNPLAAMDWAVRTYKLDRQTMPVPPAPQAMNARGAAQLPSQAARIQTPQGGEPSIEEKQRLFQLAQRTGDVGPWAQAVLRNQPLTYTEVLAKQLADMQKASG